MEKNQEKGIELKELLSLMEESLAAGRTVRFSPRGISMLPMLRQGKDSVILSPVSGKLHKYDIPFYRRDDGSFILHRIIQAGETYTCMGDNQFEKETGVKQEQIIAVVTAFTRGEKEYKVSSLRYRSYCYFWHYSRPVRHLLKRTKSFLRRRFL